MLFRLFVLFFLFLCVFLLILRARANFPSVAYLMALPMDIVDHCLWEKEDATVVMMVVYRKEDE